METTAGSGYTRTIAPDCPAPCDFGRFLEHTWAPFNNKADPKDVPLNFDFKIPEPHKDFMTYANKDLPALFQQTFQFRHAQPKYNKPKDKSVFHVTGNISPWKLCPPAHAVDQQNWKWFHALERLAGQTTKAKAYIDKTFAEKSPQRQTAHNILSIAQNVAEALVKQRKADYNRHRAAWIKENHDGEFKLTREPTPHINTPDNDVFDKKETLKINGWDEATLRATVRLYQREKSSEHHRHATPYKTAKGIAIRLGCKGIDQGGIGDFSARSGSSSVDPSGAGAERRFRSLSAMLGRHLAKYLPRNPMIQAY